MGFRAVRLVEVLEAAYGLIERPNSEWLQAILETLRPGFDQGLGVQAYFVDASQPDRFDTWGYEALGVPGQDVGIEAFERWQRLVPVEFKRRVHTFAPFGTASALPADLHGTAERSSSLAHDNREVIGVNGLDASHRGVAIAAASLRPIALPEHGLSRLWSRVAVHLATAARVRRKVPAGALGDVGEAILDPGGKVVHATGAAREANARDALRHGAKAIDKARTRGHRDDLAETLELWQALVSGRWSLVDDFTDGGRRMLVAVPNKTEIRASAVLTEREREVLGALALGHTNKLIAYELGLSVSSVATHLSRAASKLGVRGRVALVRALAADPGLIQAAAAAPAVTGAAGDSDPG